MSRLTSEVWIAAYLTRLRLAAIPAFVVKRGDNTAGEVKVPDREIIPTLPGL